MHTVVFLSGTSVAAVLLLAAVIFTPAVETRALSSEVEALLQNLQTQQEAEQQKQRIAVHQNAQPNRKSFLDYVAAKIMSRSQQAKVQDDDDDKDEKQAPHQGFGDEVPPPIEKPDEDSGEGGMVMGDMFLNKAQVESMRKLQNNEADAAIQAWTTVASHKWPGGIVPFEITPDAGPAMISAIMDAMNEYATKTCVLFVPRLNEKDYVIFKPSTRCFSAIGRQGGPQYIELSPTCYDKTVAIHEMMHALGRYHEHQRPDRDDYISIQWPNVKGGVGNLNFVKLPNGIADTYGKPYDLQSIMHYPADSDSVNGLPTILPHDPFVPLNSIGAQPPFGTFSIIDIQHLNSFYPCPFPPPLPGLPPPIFPPPPPGLPVPIFPEPLPPPLPGLPPPIFPPPPPGLPPPIFPPPPPGLPQPIFPPPPPGLPQPIFPPPPPGLPQPIFPPLPPPAPWPWKN